MKCSKIFVAVITPSLSEWRSLYLLLLYQQILTENDQVNPTYINSNDLEYLMGLDLVVSEEELKVSNKLYKEVF